MLGYTIAVPPYVRQALLSRSINNDDILPTIRKPILITHGAQDAIVKPSAVDLHKSSLRHAVVQIMANAGHAAFWDDAPTFNLPDATAGGCQPLIRLRGGAMLLFFFLLPSS